jgi:OmpA-OmpF porin, OOP family
MVNRPLVLLLGALLALAVPATATWASDDPTRRGFDADPARLALGAEAGFGVETATPVAPGRWSTGAVLEAAGGLLTLSQGGTRRDLLEQRGTLHLLGSWSLGRVELMAELPVVLWQRSDLSLLTGQGVTGPLVDPIASTSLGDLRLASQLALLDAAEGRWPLGLAARLELRLPTGDRRAFTCDGLSLVPGLVATRALGPVRLDAQIGYVLRDQGQYAQLVVHDGLAWGLGGSLDLPPLRRLQRWRAIAELSGAIPRGFDADSARYRSPLGLRLGLRAFPTPRLAIELGGGTGLGDPGYGHERWRVFLGVRLGSAPAPAQGTEPDRDGDGVPDARDRCPDEAGPAELDGCPDRDGDGIPDREDRCPDQPGPATNDGCPLAEDEPVVTLDAKRVSLKEAISFDTDRDTIRMESFHVLDQVARLLVAHPELTHLRVEGHTDNVGAAAYNKDLSARRAAAVVRALVVRGVASSRLVAAGFGFERPVASNETALGRAKNRRVELVVLGETGEK